METFKFDKLKESVTIEGKRCKNTLPKSIWETYSAFANTQGGYIILGVDEDADGYLIPAGVNDTDEILKNFWSTINNKQKVNTNLLIDNDVEIQIVENNKLILIHVPMASREVKPVYINDNLFSGSYRRNGEGDYHCTLLEINNMLRDQSEQTQDYKIAERYTMDHVNSDSLNAYRNLFKTEFPNHPWVVLEDQEFLYRISGMDKDKDGEYRLTQAGLLMFSYDYEIEKMFPDYFLDYQELLDTTTRWTNRIHSGEGTWSGNLFEFFFKVMPNLSALFKNRFELGEQGRRVEEPAALVAVREALINCISNANFYDTYGIVIKSYPNKLVFENPGILRIPMEKALIGGNSNPRNKAIMKMFSLIGFGERAGSGIPNILAIWKSEHWPSPEIRQEYNHDRTILTLQYTLTKLEQNTDILAQPYFSIIYQYMQTHDYVKTTEIAKLLDVKNARARQILKEMSDQKLINTLGAKKNRIYKLFNK